MTATVQSTCLCGHAAAKHTKGGVCTRCSCSVYECDDMPATAPLATQVGGRHYKDMKIQPIEYILANGIGFVEGAVIKYVSRWRDKGGVEDLKKARHFLDILIAHETTE